jgi:hypothetical protein
VGELATMTPFVADRALQVIQDAGTWVTERTIREALGADSSLSQVLGGLVAKRGVARRRCPTVPRGVTVYEYRLP